MNLSSQKQSSLYLLLGTFLMFVTMILHPMGGNFKHLLAVSRMGVIAHSLAILSLPFSALGFIGLSQHLGINRFFSRLGLAIMLLGLVAAMLAAAVNGLTLPFFINDYAEANQATISAIQPILQYNMAFNHSFDYLLIGAMFLSMFLWSISIYLNERLPRWVAYLGFFIVAAVLAASISGFYFLDLFGFRMFVFGWLVWIIAAAVSLWSSSEETV